MTAGGFLTATLVAAVVVLVVAWWVAQHERDRTAPPSSHEPAPRPGGARRAGRAGELDVARAYRAAIARARLRSTGQLLDIFYAGTGEPVPTTAEGLFDWLAAHHVLVAERDVTLLATATSSTTSAGGNSGGGR